MKKGKDNFIYYGHCGNDYSENPLPSIWSDQLVKLEGKDWNGKRACRPTTAVYSLKCYFRLK